MSAEKKRLGGLLVVVALVLGYWLFPKGGTPAAAPKTPRTAEDLEAGASARRGRREGVAVDPNDIKDVDLQGSRGELVVAVHRNIFRFYVRPTPVPTPVPPVPTPFPMHGQPGSIGPDLPTPTPQPTPIIPPAIPYTAIGIFGPKEKPIVTLEDSGRLINAREGDTLDGRFILRKINRESVDFAFVGLPNDITQRLPVAGNASR
jgi:hypothetical protein